MSDKNKQNEIQPASGERPAPPIEERIRKRIYDLWCHSRGGSFGQASWQGFVRDAVREELKTAAPGISGEAQPSVTYEFQTDDTVRVTANQAGEAQPLRERARIIAEKLAELGFHRDCGNNDRLVIANELETMEEFIELLSLASPDVKVSRTFGELPEAIRAMIEPHAWDNMNISEQRDWALAQLAQSFADDEVVQNHTNQVLDAYENDLKALALPESPRCPKCGGKRLAIIMSNAEDKKLANPYVVCYDEGRPDHKIYFSHVADFAQFFAAPSTPLVLRCSACAGTMLYQNLPNGEVKVFRCCAKAATPQPAAWTPCAERLPEAVFGPKGEAPHLSEDVLVYFEGGDCQYEVANYDYEIKLWTLPGHAFNHPDCDPTHWRPLPASPPSPGGQMICGNCKKEITGRRGRR